MRLDYSDNVHQGSHPMTWGLGLTCHTTGLKYEEGEPPHKVRATTPR
jgi:hypothetical protein